MAIAGPRSTFHLYPSSVVPNPPVVNKYCDYRRCNSRIPTTGPATKHARILGEEWNPSSSNRHMQDDDVFFTVGILPGSPPPPCVCKAGLEDLRGQTLDAVPPEIRGVSHLPLARLTFRFGRSRLDSGFGGVTLSSGMIPMNLRGSLRCFPHSSFIYIEVGQGQ